MKWQSVIGLEIHAQLATESKIFSSASSRFGAETNANACAVDLGLPGVLPVLNEKVVLMAIKFGLAVNAVINKRSVFARKNYFYPDLPKGYQISQFELPIVGAGHLIIQVADSEKKINITRAHLEEDAGKSIHDIFTDKTAIDLNRAGIPLLEIVSEPDMRSAKEAVAYAKKIHTLLRYLKICDGNMQEGSFRCDANVSIRANESEKLGTRTELKNINSFRFLEKAINYEINRQQDVLENGGKITQETRLYDSDKDETRPMRSKEEANDYRYFPDPDLLPLIITDDDITALKKQLPELPDIKKKRFMTAYQLSTYDAEILTGDHSLADYFETLVAESQASAKLCANWLTGDFLAALNKDNMELANAPVSATDLAQLIARISDNTISGKIAKTVFLAMWQEQGSADEIIAKQGLKQISNSDAIVKMIETVINDNPAQVMQYKNGQDKLFGFFVGQVMKLSKGQANPAQVNTLLKEKLKS